MMKLIVNKILIISNKAKALSINKINNNKPTIIEYLLFKNNFVIKLNNRLKRKIKKKIIGKLEGGNKKKIAIITSVNISISRYFFIETPLATLIDINYNISL